MKICPKCHTSYDDDNLNYCLDDGTALLAGSYAAPTVVMPPPRLTTDPPQQTVPAGGWHGGHQVAQAPARKSRAWIWVLLILGLVILLCGGGVGGLLLMSRDRPAVTREPASPSPVPSSTRAADIASTRAAASGLSMANYRRLETGMSRADVERILGGKGTEISSASGGGMEFTVNQWEGEDYKSIIITFQNDKIISKTQVGLDE